MYRIFHGLSPKYFSDCFHASVKANFNLRDNLKLHPTNITMIRGGIRGGTGMKNQVLFGYRDGFGFDYICIFTHKRDTSSEKYYLYMYL